MLVFLSFFTGYVEHLFLFDLTLGGSTWGWGWFLDIFNLSTSAQFIETQQQDHFACEGLQGLWQDFS